MEKFSENSGLGISLDVCAGRHILCSVLPEGPVGRSGKICSGDELLEVKHIHRKQPTTNMHQKISFILEFGPNKATFTLQANMAQIWFFFCPTWDSDLFLSWQCPAGTQRCDVGWPKFNVNSTSNVYLKLMSNTDVGWRWCFVVFRLCNQNLILCQCQILTSTRF